jgi:4'-phosphopantetheinyl transferase
MDAASLIGSDPATVAIGPGQVHAWLVDLDGRTAGEGVLDAAERDRAASYLRPHDGARFAASRAAVRLILSRYLDCPPERLRFVTGRSGQPQLARQGLRFSLSRSGGLAIIAVSPDEVGADVELLRSRPGLPDLVAARFTAAEAACIAVGCAGSPTRGFFRHWTAKEAYLKAAGCGLAGLRDAELVCRAVPVIRLRGMLQPGWKLSIADRSRGYVAAVAASQSVTSWRRFTG